MNFLLGFVKTDEVARSFSLLKILEVHLSLVLSVSPLLSFAFLSTQRYTPFCYFLNELKNHFSFWDLTDIFEY